MGIETMLTVAIYSAIAGAVVGAGSGAYSAYVENDNAIDTGKAADKQAGLTQEAAQQDAANIRDKAARLKGMQAAGLASAGVKLDNGTANVVMGETDRLSEQDALAAIKEGSQRADLIKEQGQLTAGNFRSQAVASALGGVSSILGSVTSYQNATKGTRIADLTNLNTNAALTTRSSSAPKYSLLGG
jgi:hypothetical protein